MLKPVFEALNPASVERRGALTADAFGSEFLRPGKPVVLTELMADWPATRDWSIDHLQQVAGDCQVPVYSSQPARDKQHQHAAAATLSLRDYLERLKQGEKDLRIFFYNILEGAPMLMDGFRYPDLGMTFFKRLPVLFAGGRGARAQMHYDIDLADLVLCHFGGPKTVLLFAPEQTPHMYKVPFSFSALHDVDFANPDFDRYPALRHLKGAVAKLQHGEALFIPSGYWHYIVYDDIGFSLTLRAMPTQWARRAAVARNILFTRTVEGLMRKLIGQRWNDRNERLAVERTHQALAGNG